MSYSVKGKGKVAARKRRHLRVRKRVFGTTERPRLAVFRSNRHMVAQVIDDQNGRTLAAASTLEAELRSEGDSKTEAARKVGQAVAERAKAAATSSSSALSLSTVFPRS